MCVCTDPPFEHAKATDKWYAPMATNDPKKFWKQHRGCGVSPQAKDLISKMLACDPEKRIPIAAIKQHPWYNGDVYPLCFAYILHIFCVYFV